MRRKKERIKELFNGKPPLCACGCNREVEWSKSKRNWNLYINKHSRIGAILSEETKKKILEKNKGRKRSEETKRKMSESLSKEKNGFYGKYHSQESKKKISDKIKEWYKENKNPMFGRRHSEEAKKKISEKNKGLKRTEEAKKKLSDVIKKKGHPMFGRKHSEESKRKMSKAKIGRFSGENHPQYNTHKSEETKRKISEIKIGKKLNLTKEQRKNRSLKRCGPKNPMWNGGISIEPYCDAWADKEYKEDIKKRDNYTCQNSGCNKKSKRLVVHHIDYVKKNCKPNNLITLCNSCNSKANGNRNCWVEFYTNILKGR